jgi:L-seryl-tRNA(Ser) seleniumtransferase
MDLVGDPDGHAALRQLPAVSTLLAEPDVAPLIARFGRALVADAARSAIATSRKRILESGRPENVTGGDVARAISAMNTRSLRRVINATGVILHTNLGRAPLARAAEEAIIDVARGYCSVEFDVAKGERGDRHRHVADLLASLLNCDGGLVFNNNAGAVMIMLAALCRGKEVIVARGELVEIGGGFRVPDVMKESGATLVEVGTTNKVYDRDYAAAITERTAAILRVHRSNFAIVGFTAEPEAEALAALAREKKIAFLVDNGSGLLATDRDLGDAAAVVREEPRPADVLKQGADLVAFSGDKLLGGPQAGIIAGKADLLAKVRKHPFARALRADKLTLAALEATLRLYRDERAREIPVIRDLAAPLEALETRALRIAGQLAKQNVDVKTGESVAGGGSLPLARLPTKLVLIGRPGEEARLLAEALREGEPPVITRVVEDRTALDVRTISEEEVDGLGPVVERAFARIQRDLKESR